MKQPRRRAPHVMTIATPKRAAKKRPDRKHTNFPIAASLRLYEARAQRTVVFTGEHAQAFPYRRNGDRMPQILMFAVERAARALKGRAGVPAEGRGARVYLLTLDTAGFVTAVYDVPSRSMGPGQVIWDPCDFGAAMIAMGATDVAVCYDKPDADLTPAPCTMQLLRGVVKDLRAVGGHVQDVMIRSDVGERCSWVSFAGLGVLTPKEETAPAKAATTAAA